MSDEDEFSEFQSEVRRKRLRLIALVALVITAIGILPWLIGFGFLGSRLVFSKKVTIYAINTSTETRLAWVEMPGPFAGRSARTELAPNSLQRLTSLSGRFDLVLADDDGAELERTSLNARDDIFYNPLGEACLAVFDLTPFYGNPNAPEEIPILDRIPQGTAIYEITADTLVLPRRLNPQRAAGAVHWIEDFGCDLLEPDQAGYLEMRAALKLQERYEQALEHQQELERARTGG